MMDDFGQPKPRHSYIHVPQPGRRGVLVHNGQIPNGAPPTGVVAGGVGYGYGGGGYYPGVYGAHTTPLYYGPNVSTSTYSNNYHNYPSYSYSSYNYAYAPLSYYSPYAYGVGSGLYANYYHPYQRSYYYNTGVAAPAYSYAYPAVGTVMPATTTYTVTNSHAVPMTTTTTTLPQYTTHTQGISTTREDIQYENRRIATQRGAYNARRIKPADALPDDPFWCKERTGEWHLRTFYQIENECHPGHWLMDPTQGFLVFHRE